MLGAIVRATVMDIVTVTARASGPMRPRTRTTTTSRAASARTTTTTRRTPTWPRSPRTTMAPSPKSSATPSRRMRS
eukprot:495154-Alexandrium_andersonii.AAC.1